MMEKESGIPREKKRLDALEEDCPHNYVAEVLDNPDNVVSATGATGTIQTPPKNEAEADNYQDLYAVPQQKQELINPWLNQDATKSTEEEKR